MNHHRRFAAKMDNLYLMLNWIDDAVSKNHFSDHAKGQIRLAIEEALSNIILYAYPETHGDIDITCNTPKNLPGIIIIIKDRGIPFNPISKANQTQKTSANVDLDKQAVGGYGILLIFGIMDQVDYQYRDGENILTLTKYK